MRKAIVILFNLGLLFIPLIFYAKTSEVFEFNKIVYLYISAVIIAGLWAARMVNERKFIFRRTILDVPLIIFFASQVISTLVSIDPRSSIFGYYSRFNGGLLSTVCYILLYWAYVSNVKKEETKKLINVALAAGLIVSIYGIFEHFGKSFSCLFLTGIFNDDCWVQDVRTRVFATLGQPNWMAAYLVALLPFSWALSLKYWQSKNKWLKVTYVVLGAVFFWAILYTKSRSGLIALGVAALTFTIFGISSKTGLKEKVKKNYITKMKKVLVPGLVISGLLLTAVVASGTPWTPSLSDFITQKNIAQKKIELDKTSEGGTESGDIRKIVWKGALAVWRAYPLFGSGPETFAFTYYMYRPVEHNLVSEWDFLYNKAHNQYLNFAANTGTVGLLSYLTVIGISIYMMVPTVRKKKIDDDDKYLLTALLSGYISILITNFFGFSVVVVDLIFFLSPALAVTVRDNSKQESSKNLLSGGQKLADILILLFVIYLLFVIGRYWSADANYAKAKAEIQLGRVTDAVTDLGLAIKKSPGEPLYHDKLSQIYAAVAAATAEQADTSSAKQLADAAISESDKARSLAPKNFIVLQDRANIYSDLSGVDSNYFLESVKTLEYLTTYAPTYAKMYYKLGISYLAIGQKEMARETLKKAVAVKPNYTDAIKALESLTNQKSP